VRRHISTLPLNISSSLFRYEIRATLIHQDSDSQNVPDKKWASMGTFNSRFQYECQYKKQFSVIIMNHVGFLNLEVLINKQRKQEF
jgi:hypothetical protein